VVGLVFDGGHMPTALAWAGVGAVGDVLYELLPDGAVRLSVA
jgi:hypothetical protein